MLKIKIQKFGVLQGFLLCRILTISEISVLLKVHYHLFFLHFFILSDFPTQTSSLLPPQYQKDLLT